MLPWPQNGRICGGGKISVKRSRSERLRRVRGIAFYASQHPYRPAVLPLPQWVCNMNKFLLQYVSWSPGCHITWNAANWNLPRAAPCVDSCHLNRGPIIPASSISAKYLFDEYKNVIVPLRLEWGQNDLSCQCDIEDDDTKTSDGMIMRYG